MGTCSPFAVTLRSDPSHLVQVQILQSFNMAYSWDNRVKFIVRYMYDIDNNGFLDKNDFECLAVRNTVIETKGKWCENVFKKNQEIMSNLWNEIADLADFNKDGEVSVEEFKKGIEKSCKGNNYSAFPQAFKFFIDSSFRTIDVDGDGSVGLDEYRSDCVKRMAYKSIADLDAAYEKLLSDDDKARVASHWNATKSCTPTLSATQTRLATV